MSRVKFIADEEAAMMIEDNSSLCVNGFVQCSIPEELFKAVENRFLETGHPRSIKLMFTASVGCGEEGGINHFAHEGLIRETYGAHYGVIRKLSPLINENKIKAYNIPQGVIIHLYRAMGGHQPGIITHVGLNTFIDPDFEGGRLNTISDEEQVKKIQIEGKDYLFYKAPKKIDYCLIRGTEADEDGNISFRNEGITLDGLTIAIATRNSGGKVIVQVAHKVKNGTIDPKAVKIPGILVDYAVVAKDKENHKQTGDTYFNEEFVSNRYSTETINQTIKYDVRKIIARRCAMMTNKNYHVLNFGVGMPELVSGVLGEEGIASNFTTTVESGIIGGIALSGPGFGMARYPQAILDAPYQFDFYDGGGIDMAFLGMGEANMNGDINVSKLGSLITGSGGFIDIAQNAKSVVFCGTFTAGGLAVAAKDGKLEIISEGKSKKFVNNLVQVTYAGNLAGKTGQKAYIVTERAVFSITGDGVTLIEIAPGVDLEKDVVGQMEFRPNISEDLKLMDERIFMEEPMGLAENFK
jgi:propionate CoA-transferase